MVQFRERLRMLEKSTSMSSSHCLRCCLSTLLSCCHGLLLPVCYCSPIYGRVLFNPSLSLMGEGKHPAPLLHAAWAFAVQDILLTVCKCVPEGALTWCHFQTQGRLQVEPCSSPSHSAAQSLCLCWLGQRILGPWTLPEAGMHLFPGSGHTTACRKH